MRLRDLRERVDKLLAERRAAITKIKTEREAMRTVIVRIRNIEKAQKITQIVAQSIQESAHAQIAAIVSRCLDAVFDNPYEFKILFNRKRGRTEAELVFFRNGNKVRPRAVGGGVKDVASLALRLAVLLLSKPRPRKLLILDEPFKHVSADHMPLVRDLVMSLSQEFGIQFIMVTHKKHLRVGKVITLGED